MLVDGVHGFDMDLQLIISWKFLLAAVGRLSFRFLHHLQLLLDCRERIMYQVGLEVKIFNIVLTYKIF